MPHADIHEFTAGNTTIFGDDNEPLFGFYYSIVVDNKPGPLFGPYSSATEAEGKAQNAWLKDDY